MKQSVDAGGGQAPMTGPIDARLAELRLEQQRGERILADLKREARDVCDGLLRLAGAIMALDEFKAADGASKDSEAEEPPG